MILAAHFWIECLPMCYSIEAALFDVIYCLEVRS